MAIQIGDGQGKNGPAGVDNENRLKVVAAVQSFDEHINQSEGKVWSIPFEGLNPAGADDYVIYIKNTGDKVINISDIRIMADTAATQIELHAVEGTAVGGTAITPVSRTVGSAATATATIESGTDITGLTSGGIIFFIQCAVVNVEYHLSTSSKIRIPKGQAVALLVETATANITGVVSIIEEE
jgi:hypothetical protein